MCWSVVALIVALLPSATIGAQSDTLPSGWTKAGSAPRDFEVGTDTNVRRNGTASAYIRNLVPEPAGFAVLYQAFAANQYRGKRVRLAGYLRGEKVRRNDAALYMRMDDQRRAKPVAFASTQYRLTPGPEWLRAELVLDVPMEAVVINFGFLLGGPGQLWLDDLTFEEVSRDVPTTDPAMPTRPLPTGPTNLDFEKKPPRPPTTDG